MAGKYPFQSLKLSVAALCEYALESRGRWTLVGTFRQLEFHEFPAMLDRMEIYLLFTDVVAQPPATVSTSLYESEHDFFVPLFDLTVSLQTGSSPRSWEAVFRIDELVFERPGVYDLTVELGGEVFELIKLYVEESK